jgi:DNA-binding transcriptional MerR regulator
MTSTPSEPPPDRLTIEQLSAETGLSVRNIRSHRTAGLLPAPEVRDGLGYYGPEHVSRLAVIRDLQAEGFNLKGIKRLLDQVGGPAAGLLGVRRALTAPAESEPAQVVTAAELAERLGEHATPAILRRALELEALAPIDDERFELLYPGFLDMAEQIARRGIPLDTALDLFALVKQDSRHVAAAFVEAFFEHVYRPFTEAGYPDERWAEVIASVDELRPLASQGLLAIFQRVMADEIEDRLGEEIRRLTRERE